MNTFEQFRQKQFATQFQMLQEVEAAKNLTIIPELFSLVENPLGDEVMDSMVQATLKKLLAFDEPGTAAGLRSKCNDLKKICVQVVGDNQFPEAGKVLKELAMEQSEPLFEILTACSKFQDQSMVPVFQKYLKHQDPLLCTLSIQNLGRLKDASSLPFFLKAIENCGNQDSSSSCELIAAEAISAMSTMGSEECFFHLSSYTHHNHPILRRFVHLGLIQGGSLSIPFLETRFQEGSHDERIMIANILGEIRMKEAGMALIHAVGKQMEQDSNVRHAIYEAFGKIHFPDGVNYLVQGLQEEDILLLLSVIHSLDEQVNSGILMLIRKLLMENLERYNILLEAIVTARAQNLFQKLYKDRNLQPLLLDYLERSGDPFLMVEFLALIPEIPRERFQPYIDAKKARCFLVVDDSPSILRFMSSVLTDAQTEIVTATNGEEAMGILEKGKTIHLIVTDMNMPKMNGVELTRKLRGHFIFSQLPIIMVTTETEEDQKAFARRAGVDAFITKPFNQEDLKKEIELILS